MKVEENKKKRKWRSPHWLDAVFAATTKIRVIRVAHALFKACDGETGESWAGRDRIHKLSRIADLDNFRKALKELEQMKAIEILPFEAMPDEMRAAATSKGKSPDGVWFRMNFAWSDDVLASENDPVKLTANDDEAGQIDRDDTVKSTADDRSNRPESGGQIDPPYLSFKSSHQSSPNLATDGDIDLDEMIMAAIDSRDDTPLRKVSLRDIGPRFVALIGRDLYEAWLDGKSTWVEILGGMDGKASQKQSA